jgi:hypothetical protein
MACKEVFCRGKVLDGIHRYPDALRSAEKQDEKTC